MYAMLYICCSPRSGHLGVRETAVARETPACQESVEGYVLPEKTSDAHQTSEGGFRILPQKHLNCKHVGKIIKTKLFCPRSVILRNQTLKCWADTDEPPRLYICCLQIQLFLACPNEVQEELEHYPPMSALASALASA